MGRQVVLRSVTRLGFHLVAWLLHTYPLTRRPPHPDRSPRQSGPESDQQAWSLARAAASGGPADGQACDGALEKPPPPPPPLAYLGDLLPHFSPACSGELRAAWG